MSAAINLPSSHLSPAALTSKPDRRARAFGTVIFFILLVTVSLTALAQSGSDYEAERKRAFELFDEHKLIEALPLLEKLAAARPSDVAVLERLVFATLAQVETLKGEESRKQGRLRARNLALRAKELGSNNELIQAVIEQVPADDSEPPRFSADPEIEKAMREGEAAFVKGDLDQALAAYGQALKRDPKLYEAALFIGDVYYKMKQMEKAGEWFARTIEINPNRETAYRYWGDALMHEGKTNEARAKFIEAIIAEPYNRLSWVGLIQWAERNNIQLAHPLIEPPGSIKIEKDQTNITLDPSTLGQTDGSESWTLYHLTRAVWINGKFLKEHPTEKEYRHSLREEAEALRMVAEAVQQKIKEGQLKTSALALALANLIKLQEAGLLEAFILIARPDEGIARDYESYRATNREQLRRYLSEYVIRDRK